MNDNNPNQIPQTTAPSVQNPPLPVQQVAVSDVQPEVPTTLNQPAVPPPSPGGKMKLIIAVVILVIIVVGAVVGFFLLRGREAEPTTGNITLTWWGLWEDETIVQPLIEEYQAANPNITINYETQRKEGYRERLTNSMAKGSPPDIFRLHNSWVPMFKRELAILPATVMSQNDFRQTFYPVHTDDLTTTKGIVGIPLEYDGLALFINEDIFTTFAEPIPTRWVQLRKTANTLTIKTKSGGFQQAGAALGFANNIDHWEEILALLILQNKGNPADPTSVEFNTALEFYFGFAKSGVWDPTFPNSTTAFATGKVAMYFGPSWRVFDIQAINPNLNFKIVPVPQLLKEDPNDTDITYATYWFEGVWERSLHKEAAWNFLKFMSSKESLEKLYANASQTRTFGEPYPRIEMRESLLSNTLVGPFVQLAPNARSWYLHSSTFDGETGINTQLSGYFKDSVNRQKVEKGLISGVEQVLQQYGIQ